MRPSHAFLRKLVISRQLTTWTTVIPSQANNAILHGDSCEDDHPTVRRSSECYRKLSNCTRVVIATDAEIDTKHPEPILLGQIEVSLWLCIFRRTIPRTMPACWQAFARSEVD